MKTGDLIVALMAADPSGELEVTIENLDVEHVCRQPAYHDGCARIMHRDEDGDIVAAEYRSLGEKVDIRTCSIADMVNANPEFPVGYDCDHARRNYAEAIEKVRETARRRKEG